MQQPAAFDPDWRTKYRELIATPAEAVGRLRAGNRVFVGTGCGTPAVLVEALVRRAHELADVEIIHLLTMGDAPYADRKLTECFLVNSFFIGANIRSHIQEGLGNYTPIMLIDIPHLFNSGQIPLDAVLLQVSPPDVHGKVSLGISVDVVKSAAENGSLVIAQVNPRMPRTLGDSFMDVADLDLLVPAERALLEIPPPEPTEVTRLIGENVAGLIEDGSTVEFGIGRIPHAVVEFLKKKKDLGIHTEMLTDSVIDLIESGAVTGARKRLDRGLVVASFCMGSKRLYEIGRAHV
jgi:acyl-CoA hydrolase